MEDVAASSAPREDTAQNIKRNIKKRKEKRRDETRTDHTRREETRRQKNTKEKKRKKKKLHSTSDLISWWANEMSRLLKEAQNPKLG